MNTIIRDNPAESRYEIWLDDEQVGFAVYKKSEEVIAFTHTQIDEGHEGQGLASKLVKYALDDVRTQNLPVLPLCPYVQRWIDRHPDYQDLLGES